MWTYNGRRINEGDAWTDGNGTQHPANWYVWSDEEKQTAGLVWVDTTGSDADQRFYWVTSNSDGSFTVTPKDITTLKKEWISTIKVTANAYLSQSDWEIIAKVERNREISTETETYRLGVISVCNSIENEINACSTVEDLIPIINSIGSRWPEK